MISVVRITFKDKVNSQNYATYSCRTEEKCHIRPEWIVLSSIFGPDEAILKTIPSQPKLSLECTWIHAQVIVALQKNAVTATILSV